MSVCGDLRDRCLRKSDESIGRSCPRDSDPSTVARPTRWHGSLRPPAERSHTILSVGGCRVPHHLASRSRHGVASRLPPPQRWIVLQLLVVAIQFEKVHPMTSTFQRLWSDQAGVILSAELVIILTIAVLGMVVGLSNLQHALTCEFADLGLAFQSLNQSFCTPSYRGCMKWGWGWGSGWGGWGGRPLSWVAGSCFYDCYDGCVGYSAYGGNGCEICSMSNMGHLPNTCPTGTCPTDDSATGNDVLLPAPSATANPGTTPVPEPARSNQPQPTF